MYSHQGLLHRSGMLRRLGPTALLCSRVEGRLEVADGHQVLDRDRADVRTSAQNLIGRGPVGITVGDLAGAEDATAAPPALDAVDAPPHTLAAAGQGFFPGVGNVASATPLGVGQEREQRAGDVARDNAARIGLFEGLWP